MATGPSVMACPFVFCELKAESYRTLTRRPGRVWKSLKEQCVVKSESVNRSVGPDRMYVGHPPNQGPSAQGKAAQLSSGLSVVSWDTGGSQSWMVSGCVGLMKWIMRTVLLFRFLNQSVSSQAVVRSLSRVWLFVTPWTAAHQASLSFTVSQSLLKLMSIGSVMTSNHLILCCPLLLRPSIFSSIRIFSSDFTSVAKILKLQLQHQSFQRIFRTDFL